MSSSQNPGHLKLELSTRGVRLDPTLRQRTDAPDMPRLPDAMPLIEILLAPGVCVSAAVDEIAAAESPFLLSGNGNRYTLERAGNGAVDVHVVSPPQFYRRTTSRGRPMWEAGRVYGNFIAVNPGGACGYGLHGAPCRFCRSGSGIPVEESFPLSIQDVVDVVRAAFDEGAAEFVYFNPPYAGTDDAGIAFITPYISAVKKHFDTLVAVEMHPPKANDWIDRTYAMGVDALSFGIEIHDQDTLAHRCAGRVRHIGRERYYDALRHAASVFPSGTVWSDLVLGLEPSASTLRGIDTLVGIGVLPVLSVFRPTDGTAPAPFAPTIERTVPIMTHLLRAVQQAGINMTWVRDLSFAFAPAEAGFFSADEDRVAAKGTTFYRSKLGNLAARSLARLRRRLRVRIVSDAFDSSHL